jgi:glycosyltransferase involved in cell wall biosynthesis
MKRLVKKGHDVTQVSAGFRNGASEETIDGVKFIRVGNKYTVYRRARRWYQKSSKKFDVVIDEINTIPFGTPHFVNRGEKVYALIHQLAREFWYYETPPVISHIGNKFLEDRWLRRYLDVPTITISDSTRSDLISLGFKNISIIHMGYDFDPLPGLAKKEETPTLVYVGRFKKAKLPDHVVEAYRLAREKVPGLRLWMIGDGYLKEKLEDRKIEGVTFFGRVSLAKKSELVSRANLLLVPGVREGWGLVVTEANAMGTPALGYNVPGLRDSIKEGRTGWLCDPNPKAMAEGIAQILSDGKTLELRSKAALVDAAQYTWDRGADEFERYITNQGPPLEGH